MGNHNARNHNGNRDDNQAPRYRSWEDREDRGTDEPWSSERRHHDWHGNAEDVGQFDRGTHRGGSSDRGGYYSNSEGNFVDRRYGDRGSYGGGPGMGGGTYQSGEQPGGGTYRRSEHGPHAGKGPQGFHRSDERIHELVAEALTDHEYIDATHVQLTVKNAEVTLSGTVEDRRTKRLAEDVVERVAGVRDVHNQLRIGSKN